MAANRPKSAPRGPNSEVYRLLEGVIEKLDDLGTSINSLDKKIDLHVQRCDFEFKSIRDLDMQQNQILQEHHDRSTQLKKDNELREEALRQDLMAKELELKSEVEQVSHRVSSLEAPYNWVRRSWKVVLGIGAFAAAIYEIVRAILELKHF